MRKTDVYGRFGGEEFVVILPSTSREQALIIAERFRSAVDDVIWQSTFISKSDLHITVSIGVVCLTELEGDDRSDLDAVINVADTFLYQAKSKGRNKVCG
jgi:diguanylate cyclase (GGDEF)-like protein